MQLSKTHTYILLTAFILSGVFAVLLTQPTSVALANHGGGGGACGNTDGPGGAGMGGSSGSGPGSSGDNNSTNDPSLTASSWRNFGWVISPPPVTTTSTPAPPQPPPACAPTFSQCITAANVCGQVNVGTQNSCTGVCSVSVPSNPSGSCSVATACGVNATGFVGCNGACNITRYPFCASVNNPDGDGEVEWITLNSGGSGGGIGVTDVRAEIFARPTLVVPQGRTIVRWISTEATSCSVSGANGDAWTGTTGEQLSGRITQETQYLLTCTGFNGAKVNDSVTVRIVPEWEEF